MKQTLSLLFLYHLRLFARLQLFKISLIQKLLSKKFTIVGITGSAGKSSTLNTCEAALAPAFKVKTNGGSNSESGIPLSILGIKATSYSLIDWVKYATLAPIMLLIDWRPYDIFLCEMGIDSPTPPKNMSYLLTILRPDIGIFLNVSSVHSESFDKDIPTPLSDSKRESEILLKIGQEKAKLIASLPPSGYALLNLSDPIVSKTSQNTLAKKIELKPIALELPNLSPPKAFEVSISAAVNLAKIFGLSEKEAILNIKNHLSIPPGRSTLLEGIQNSKIIDSSYNSSPLACVEMLKVLSLYPSPKIAVLGDMRELGLQSKNAHLQIYKEALKVADTIISVGPETSKYFGDKAVKFLYWWEADKYLKQHLKPHSTILVKGSQNTIYLEELVKSISTSTLPLCRQSPYWLKIKSEFKEKNS